MESYYKMDIESLDRKIKEHAHILREIYLMMILMTLFTVCICFYLIFDRYHDIANEPPTAIDPF